jgi:hypothetical protein
MTGYESKRAMARDKQKLPGEAQPSTISIWKQPVYKPPQMNTPRLGANDHLKVRSRG